MYFLPPKMFLQIYKLLIALYISYAIVVWGFADKCRLNKILTLQKQVLRFIYFSNEETMPSQPFSITKMYAT